MVEIGEKVPGMVLVDTELKKVDVSEAVKNGITVIAFFPGAFTSVCTKEMCRFRDDMSQLDSLGANIFAVSVDGPFSNKAFKEHNNLNFTILSDYDRSAVKAFGIELKDFAKLDGYTAAKRSIFISDNNGIVRYKWVSDDPTIEPDYKAIKTAVEELK